jgi:hypothetical protein
MKIEKTRLDGLLFAIIGSQSLVSKWWKTPNPSFDLQTPEQMFNSDPERVRDHIFAFVGR